MQKTCLVLPTLSVHASSVTRCLDYLLIFGHLQQRKFSQRHHELAELGQKCSTNANLTLKKLPNYSKHLV